MTTFTQLGLSEPILAALAKKGYEKPTEIQEKVIASFFNTDQDLIAQAQTGTGKTAAYGLPLLDKLLCDQGVHVKALILTPTRELTLQVCTELNTFKGSQTLQVCSILGGQSLEAQRTNLRKNPAVVVGSPGRLIDHIKRRNLDLSNLNYLILDEADEMLNDGFIDDIEFIMEQTPKDKRTILVSATMSAPIRSLANAYLNNYECIETVAAQRLTDNTKQYYYEVRESDKVNALCRLIDTMDHPYAIVFCKTKREVDALAQELGQRGYPAEGLHGDLSQHQRNRILGLFKQRKYQILIATDVAARGIDVSDLSHVINVSLPQDNETYVHRIGRTGRAGKEGVAISIISSREVFRLKRIEKMLKTTIEKKRIPSVGDMVESTCDHLYDRLAEVTPRTSDALDTLMTRLSQDNSADAIARTCLQLLYDQEAAKKKQHAIEDLFDRKGSEYGGGSGAGGRGRSSRYRGRSGDGRGDSRDRGRRGYGQRSSWSESGHSRGNRERRTRSY